jgi:hypothetical protein
VLLIATRALLISFYSLRHDVPYKVVFAPSLPLLRTGTYLPVHLHGMQLHKTQLHHRRWVR